MNSVSLLGVRIDVIDEARTKELLATWLGSSEVSTTKLVCTPNPEFLLAAKGDAKFAELLNSFDLNLPDGVGLRFASAALNDDSDKVIRRRVPGVLALQMLAELCAENGKSMLFIGEREVAEKAAAELRKRYSQLVIKIIDPGVIDGEGKTPTSIIDEVRMMKPKVIAVGLGQGKQEKFIRHLERNSAQVMIGVGGAFAMIGGVLRRAPRVMQRLGLEWLWRLTIEPQRWRRIWRATVVFPLTVILITLQEHKFWRAVRRTAPEIFWQLIGR